MAGCKPAPRWQVANLPHAGRLKTCPTNWPLVSPRQFFRRNTTTEGLTEPNVQECLMEDSPLLPPPRMDIHGTRQQAGPFLTPKLLREQDIFHQRYWIDPTDSFQNVTDHKHGLIPVWYTGELDSGGISPFDQAVQRAGSLDSLPQSTPNGPPLHTDARICCKAFACSRLSACRKTRIVPVAIVPPFRS